MSSNLLVVDLGTGETKCAALTTHKFAHFPSVIGRLQPFAMGTSNLKPFYIGDEALQLSGFLQFRYPIEQGLVGNAGEALKLVEHAVTSVTSNVHSGADNTLILGERVDNTSDIRAQTMQVVMEGMSCIGKMSIIPTPILALYGDQQQKQSHKNHTNPLTGMVVENGDGITCITQVKNGIIQHTAKQEFAGRLLTDYLMKMLYESGIQFVIDRGTVQAMKEKLCFVAPDFEESISQCYSQGNTHEVQYTVPSNGIIVKLSSERFRCPEPMFQPAIVGYETLGLADSLFECLFKSDLDCRKDLVQNILMVGGSSSFKNIETRLCKDLKQMLPKALVPSAHVHKNVDPYLNVKAALAMGSEPSFQQFLVSRAQYDEEGAERCCERLMCAYTIKEEGNDNAIMTKRNRLIRTALALEEMVSLVTKMGEQLQTTKQFKNVTIQFTNNQ